MIDPARLSAHFDAHAAALVLYARQIVAEPAAAEDVVHDAFVGLMTLAGPEPHDPRAWLFRAVRNAAIGRKRSWWRRARRDRAASAARPEMFDARVDDLIDAKDAQTALAALPAEQREVVVLRIWGGMGFAEIAELVRASVSTVHDRYKSALAEMKRNLEATRCQTNR